MKFKPGDKVMHADGDRGCVISPQEYAAIRNLSVGQLGISTKMQEENIFVIWEKDGAIHSPASECKLIRRNSKQLNLPTWW